ncbi:cobalamin-binding protein [Alteromonas sp. 1_MG-2023]|uniref:cobalamin-binding protein n=1 Tax=Alteromonas sp. 1_MG-2023 TaxID=3062669 RepID=UPI0026E122C4|nr:cobalamin-binding protein [Alteromonas sp. 1_MG-2023]MDO6567242.1 cobalamin-binding protein [Alteromonas sp. 1_MG-2023]
MKSVFPILSLGALLTRCRLSVIALLKGMVTLNLYNTRMHKKSGLIVSILLLAFTPYSTTATERVDVKANVQLKQEFSKQAQLQQTSAIQAGVNQTSANQASEPATRIITLAPHLTEWVYSLGLEAHLIGVSDYSNFPQAAQLLPTVADYQGADLSQIMTLQPTLILAWEGGNKPQDLHRLESLGYDVFRAKITEIEDIGSELIRLGKLTNTEEKANALATAFLNELTVLRAEYATSPYNKVFYYSWSSPLMTIGENAWPNKLLNVCGSQTLFNDSPVDYPQVSVQEVLARQPAALVAASNQPTSNLEQFWAPHRNFLSAPLIAVNPDVTSRFSLRLINELKTLCKGIN